MATLLVLVLSWAKIAVGESAATLRGVALVIGQSDYETLAQLPNPERDVDLIEEVLDGLGFDVTRVRDRKAERLRDDLADFVAEAEGADVAVVYYAGHGIEAGGENWLVPVDADLQSPATGDMLIGLSPVIEALSANVPLTLFFLDACRDNPFPEGTLLRREGTDYPINSAGLDLPRSARALDGSAAPLEAAGGATGTAIGYAAEPGQAALDGPAGGNSYYAAALARHLGASVSVEFATVMRLVTEEVWLKTGGRQRPWVNMSLTQLLYFGGAEAALSPEDALILGERRQLLLSIADLDTAVRKQVEATASAEGVPMDALYGLVRSLGAEVSGDPDALARALKAQVETLQAQLKEATEWRAEDPEIARLIDLSNRAGTEGALVAARQFADQALARVRDRRALRETVREDLRNADLEDGRVTSNAADKHALEGDQIAAAALYAEAFALVEPWDDKIAARYKFREALSLFTQGDQKGDSKALEHAIEAYRFVLRLTDRATDGQFWAQAQDNLGAALITLGEREGGILLLEEGIAAHRAALQVNIRDLMPLAWAKTQNNLGNALQSLFDQGGHIETLDDAVAAYRLALEVRTRDRVPLAWAATQNNLGNALLKAYNSGAELETIYEAIRAYRFALQEFKLSRTPIDWAMVQNNLGNALVALASSQGSVEGLEEATNAFRAALVERTRARFPLEWAETQSNLGKALVSLGILEGDTGRLEEAIVVFRTALEELRRDRVPMYWAKVHHNLGIALLELGERRDDLGNLREALIAFRSALEERTRDRAPLAWADTQYGLGLTLTALGTHEQESGKLLDAIIAFQAALDERTRTRSPLDWAETQERLGDVLAILGQWEDDTAQLEKAATAYTDALKERSREAMPLRWAQTNYALGNVLNLLAIRRAPDARADTWLQAIHAWQNAQLVWSRETDPQRWAGFRNAIGYTLVLIFEVSGDRHHLEVAVPTLREAIDVQTVEASDSLPFTQDSLCRALLNLGRLDADRSMLLEARALCLAARQGLEAVGADDAVAETDANLTAIGRALEHLE